MRIAASILVLMASPLAAQTTDLPSMSEVLAICTDRDRTLAARVDVFAGYGFEPSSQPDALWHTANAAQVALYLNGRVTPYSAGGARAQFRALYPVETDLPRIAGEQWSVLTSSDAQASVRIFQTDSGLIGCDVAMGLNGGWDEIDLPLRREWLTEAGTVQSYETPLDDQRLDVTTFTPIWADWFPLPSPPNTWIAISSRLPEITG